MRIVLDAGHGYNTQGKRTPDGMREYEFNRVVAQYAREELLRYQNVEILFTHSDDRDVPLQERTNRANNWQARAFVSIHANAFGNGGWNTAQGIETYTPTVDSPNSDRLANMVHRRLIQSTGRRDRGIKSANFHVLRETNMASVLCECGFMTFYQEAQLLKTDSYRRTCALAIAAGLVEYFNLQLKSTPPPTTRIYKVQVGAFRAKENADNLAAELRRKGFNTFVFQEQGLYKVQTGAFSEKANADRLAATLRAQGYNTFISV
ncbi:Sporulation-specific N-acetylmuramoyl-L-alanine amidase [Sutcliffiella rhizosphaerae]|uniref:Sporulation-specific N-acetylmuramoyl-L-alanine amidase n=1 Tax=Sutcliffiella rhizosphaerae TaxID=2880967 RepID=A0ABM8YNL1_9BACI|nr:Sporulation-specific N-acetylmuramoyl-L-alanine amidase [Sutcliffiella rhizosphaerae]